MMYNGCMSFDGEYTQEEAERIEACLTQLRNRFGDLNTAHVALHKRAYGDKFISQIAQDIGVSRNVVRRAIQRLSELDIR